MYLDGIHVLSTVENSTSFYSRTGSGADSLLSKLTENKPILTTYLFLAVFEVIGSISRYLQLKNWAFRRPGTLLIKRERI